MSVGPLISKIVPSAEGLDVTWSSGESDHLPTIWLRDACRCERCRDGGSDQHLIDVLYIASDVLLGATSGNAGVAVVFETADGHHEGWMPEQALAVFRDRPLPSVTWHHDHNDLLLDGAVDVAAADDLTPLGLPLHTDNPYRDPVTTLQSMEPPDMATDVLHKWYRAYRSLCAILADPGSAMEITLEPSDLVVFDNRRVLHGRSAFAVTDRRHLQGCYADIDAIRSALRIREAS